MVQSPVFILLILRSQFLWNMEIFLGMGLVPKPQERQTLMATLPRKAEPFKLNSRQRYHSTMAKVPSKTHCPALAWSRGRVRATVSPLFPYRSTQGACIMEK